MTLDLDPIRARLAAATPGPWHAWDRGIGSEVHVGAECVSETTQYERCRDLNDGFRETFAEADAALIANAPADLAALLAEVERLREAVQRVREMHYPAYNDVAHTRICESCHGKAGVHPCGCWSDEDYQPVCGHCHKGHKFSAVAYPCPTLRSLDGAE